MRNSVISQDNNAHGFSLGNNNTLTPSHAVSTTVNHTSAALNSDVIQTWLPRSLSMLLCYKPIQVSDVCVVCGRWCFYCQPLSCCSSACSKAKCGDNRNDSLAFAGKHDMKSTSCVMATHRPTCSAAHPPLWMYFGNPHSNRSEMDLYSKVEYL